MMFKFKGQLNVYQAQFVINLSFVLMHRILVDNTIEMAPTQS